MTTAKLTLHSPVCRSAMFTAQGWYYCQWGCQIWILLSFCSKLTKPWLKNTRNQASNISKKQKNTDNSVNRRLTVCSHPILVLVLILEEQKITFRQLILESNHSVRLYFIMSQIWTLCEFSSSSKTGAAWNESRNEIEMVLKITPAFN